MENQLPPHSVEDEAAALGCVLDCDNPPQLLAALTIDYFYDQRHRALYEACLAVSSESTLNIVTLTKYLAANKLGPKCGGLDYVAGLPEQKHSTANFPSWLASLKELAVRRAAIGDAAELTLLARDPSQSWTAIRTAAARMTGAYARQQADENPIAATPIGDLQLPIRDDPKELLRYRYLSEGGSLLINGPTGMGKSSFLMQCLACWSNGISAFDINPTRCLPSVLIQAENDDGDIAEMRDGICRGLNLSELQRLKFFADVRVFTSNGLTGKRFCNEVVRVLLEQHHPAVVAIDPALAFLGGDVKEQRDVSDFLRARLAPLLMEFHCACVMVHHTNKPQVGKEKADWKNGENAYLGSGSAEWANWFRASLGLKGEGSPGVYKLIASKRGSRLNWKDDEENKVYERLIVHSKEKGVICWHWGDEDDLPEKGRPRGWKDAEVIALLGGGLSTTDWQRACSDELGISKPTFYRAKTELENSGRVLRSSTSSKWVKVS